MDGMGAADHFGAFVGPGQAAQGVGQGIEFGAQQGSGRLSCRANPVSSTSERSCPRGCDGRRRPRAR